MIKKSLVSICLLVLFASFTDNPEAKKISIINLIATPEKYDGLAICVEGYYLNDFEDERLYLDESSAKNWLKENSIKLNTDNVINGIEVKKLDHKYIRIKGYFKRAPLNNINSYGDNIGKVYSMEEVKQ